MIGHKNLGKVFCIHVTYRIKSTGTQMLALPVLVGEQRCAVRGTIERISLSILFSILLRTCFLLVS